MKTKVPPAAIATLKLAEESATARLAEDVAAAARAGDIILLEGGLGAGKTSFARAFLRALAGDAQLEVPSPSFAMRIDYAMPRFAVTHADLYRLADPAEAEEVGLLDLSPQTLLLAEWPERGELDAEEALTIRLEVDGCGRSASICGGGDWPERLARSFLIRRFLDKSRRARSHRMPILGDASGRSYERVRGGADAVLMNAPARQQGPPVWHGKSYDAVAHRALDLSAFLTVRELLAAKGARVPEVYAQDLAAGLLLVEDFGAEPILTPDNRPILARYEAAVDLLLKLHRPHPKDAAARAALSAYDTQALLIETSLFADHFAAQEAKRPFSAAQREDFLATWRELLGPLQGGERVIVLRDFHSPNIIWLEGAAGTDRVGVIDFQDALIGHPAYDLASLAQDARADIAEAEEEALLRRYVAARQKAEPGFDEEALRRAYAILAAQRASKVLGAFARLARAGMPTYRAHMPRLRARLRRDLNKPVLSPLRRCYQNLL
ncbi:tRNA (adenosine(37)-N6)-threonylcarbamoyltransferase complex ATPase subunit type 1 TsaE [Afifella pfennigii]|uniref:tRNA (adenosine(37)-N6)-threonylcarbamoyltransferase complex ATPase subunit type 1 TsaE n=1 Tax=Afifella pfennigii TaxID=209897 RepID=UPI000A00165B|nr:tRNA (adenosine(37)-N6)-threonylcarbamoyltransferase complex ATPase subunit type 1 TsaE [Afifella pfennigii]